MGISRPGALPPPPFGGAWVPRCDPTTFRLSVRQPNMALPQTSPESNDVQRLERLAAAVSALRRQVAQRIVGQESVVDGVLTALLAGGHSLLIGVPGLAETLLVASFAEALALSFNRVHFTPDL